MVGSDESDDETNVAVGETREPGEGPSGERGGRNGGNREHGTSDGGRGRVERRLAGDAERGGKEGPSDLQPIARIKKITRDQDYASQMTSIITELGLTDVQAKEYFTILDHKSLEKEKTFTESLAILCKYQGFSPRDMIYALLHCWEIRHAEQPGHPETTHDYTITIDGEDRVYTFTSDERFMKDMEFICIMFITRGTAFAKISAKSTQVMRDIFNA